MTTKTNRKTMEPSIASLVTEDRDLLKGLMCEALQEVLDGEMNEALGAAPSERTADRLGYPSGHYPGSIRLVVQDSNLCPAPAWPSVS